MAKKLREPAAPSVDPALDRTHSRSADCGSLFIGQALRGHEDQGLPLVGPELGERRAHILIVDAGLLLGSGLELCGIEALRVSDLSLPLAVLRVEEVPQDREEPGTQVRTGLKAVDVALGADNRVLDQVIGPVAVVCQRDREDP